jgi:hypothetical protein
MTGRYASKTCVRGEQTQPVQRKGVVDPFDRRGLGSDETGQPTRSDDRARIAELALDARHHAVDEPGVTEHDARLHRLDGISPDHAGGLGNFDAVKLGGAGEKGIGADLNAGGDDATKVLSLLAHAVERGRRAEVDHDDASLTCS